MGNHKEISGQCVGAGFSFQKMHKTKTSNAAGSGVEHSAGKSADFQIIGDKRAGRDHNVVPVEKNAAPFFGVKGGNESGNQKDNGKPQGSSIDDLAVTGSVLLHNADPPFGDFFQRKLYHSLRQISTIELGTRKFDCFLFKKTLQALESLLFVEFLLQNIISDVMIRI